MNRSALKIAPPISPPPIYTPRILCAWLTGWPLERLAATRAELKTQAVLVYEAHGRGNLTVVGYRPAPGSAGDGSPDRPAGYRITPGMPLAEALALHQWAAVRRRSKRREAGPDANRSLHLEAYDPLADRLALVQLAQECAPLSPIVGLEEGERPECLLLDIGRVSERFGGERALARQLARLLAKRGLQARLAVADSVGAAWGLAHYAAGEPIDPGVETAGYRRGVTTLSIAPSGRMAEALAGLPIAALRLDAASLDDLDQLGVERIEQLAVLPRGGLAIRFGPAMLRRIDQALATAAEVITPCRWPTELAAEWIFESPTSRREEIEWVLAELLPRLTEPLAAQRRGVLQLVCRLESQGEPCRLVLRLFRPTICVRHLVDMFCLRLETIRLARAVTAIRLSVTASDRLNFEQQTLFDVASPDAGHRQLAQTIDRLTHRLSREAVLRPVMLADAQAEYACQYLPIEGTGRDAASRAAGRASGRAKKNRVDQQGQNRPAVLSTQDRPTRLYTPAVALCAVTVAPDGAPASFEFHGRRQRVARAWGPERIETGWWRTRLVRRDYYRVETATAERYWLFRCLTENRWFLQGAFD